MTIADRVRAHPLWPAYLASEERSARAAVSTFIATDLGLTERQRVDFLPKIAKRVKPRGRPWPPPEPYLVKCPYCRRELEVVVPRRA